MLLECENLKWCKAWLRVVGIVLVLLLEAAMVTRAMMPLELEKNVVVTAAQGEDTIPSIVSKDGLVLKGRLGDNGKEYVFLLDTGAEMSVIDSQLVEELKLSKLLEVDGVDSSGNTDKVKIYQADYMAVGKMTVHNLPILALDMKFLKTEYGVPIDGLIGYNFLKYFTVILDYQKNQVVLLQRHPLVPTEGALVAKLNKNDFRVILPVTVNGISFRPFIDTGAIGAPLYAPSEILEKCEIKRYSKGGITAGALGSAVKNIVAMAHVTIGNYDFKEAVVTSSATPVVGQDFLSQFTVVLDYPEEKAWLFPNGKIELSKDEYSLGLGMGQNEQGIFVVTGVWEGSPADLAHIHVGDKIIAINGVKTSEKTGVYWRGVMRDKAVSRLELMLEKPQGAYAVVTLEKAYLLSSKYLRT